MISRRRLILYYTTQQVIPNICTKFQNPRFSSSWEILLMKKNVYIHTHQHTHTHTRIVTEKTKTIYPLYTSYTGGIITCMWPGWGSNSKPLDCHITNLTHSRLCYWPGRLFVKWIISLKRDRKWTFHPLSCKASSKTISEKLRLLLIFVNWSTRCVNHNLRWNALETKLSWVFMFW